MGWLLASDPTTTPLEVRAVCLNLFAAASPSCVTEGRDRRHEEENWGGFNILS